MRVDDGGIEAVGVFSDLGSTSSGEVGVRQEQEAGRSAKRVTGIQWRGFRSGKAARCFTVNVKWSRVGGCAIW